MSTHSTTLEYDMTSMGLYLASIGNLPRLTHAEEQTLALRIKNGDEQAKQEMILANLKLVVYVARRYGTSEMDLLDHIQNGYFGLVKAVERFDGGRNIHFSTYAVHWIRQAVTREQQRHRHLVHLPFYIQDQIHKMDKATDEWFLTHGTEVPLSFLSDALEVEIAHIQMLQSLRSRTLSLDYAANDTDETTLAEQTVDAEAPSPDAEVSEQDEQNMVREQIRHALAILTERERVVITFSFGLDGSDKRSYAEIGRSLGISRERVRQLLQSALTKLRHAGALQSLLHRLDEMRRTA